MKKIIALVLVLLMVCGNALASGIDWASMTDSQIIAAMAEAEAELDNRSTPLAQTIVFTLDNLNPGEYGKYLTLNKDTEFESTIIMYYIPEGRYYVENHGDSTVQIAFCVDGTEFVDGWEYPIYADKQPVCLMWPDTPMENPPYETYAEIVVERGEYIKFSAGICSVTFTKVG